MLLNNIVLRNISLILLGLIILIPSILFVIPIWLGSFGRYFIVLITFIFSLILGIYYIIQGVKGLIGKTQVVETNKYDLRLSINCFGIGFMLIIESCLTAIFILVATDGNFSYLSWDVIFFVVILIIVLITALLQIIKGIYVGFKCFVNEIKNV